MHIQGCDFVNLLEAAGCSSLNSGTSAHESPLQLEFREDTPLVRLLATPLETMEVHQVRYSSECSSDDEN
jgi:hypothetical protein